MPVIKHRTECYRVLTTRNVEDWRSERRGEGQPWAIHCVSHDQRTFYPSYQKAKHLANLPLACPNCELFDVRCTFCPSELKEWTEDPSTGYTPSTGHIRGIPVCEHHKYGAIPEGVDYLQVHDVVKDKPVVEIFIGAAFTGSKVLSSEFYDGDQTFWAKCTNLPRLITQQSLAELQAAFQFAGVVLAYLNRPSDATDFFYETWEARARRASQVQQ